MSFKHVIFLVHGFLGKPSNFSPLIDQLASLPGVLVHPLGENAGNRSLDGLEVCTSRAIDEIAGVISGIGKENRVVSLVGHSWGGLLVRSICSKVSWQDLGLTPGVIVTMQTPHLGICSVDLLYNMSQHWIVTKTGSKTVHEMQLRDSDKLSDCILYKMTTPVYTQPLAGFRKFHLAVHEDYVVRACSAAMGKSMAAVSIVDADSGWAVLQSEVPYLQAAATPKSGYTHTMVNKGPMASCSTCECSVPVTMLNNVGKNMSDWRVVWLGTCLKSHLAAHLFTVDRDRNYLGAFSPTLVGLLKHELG